MARPVLALLACLSLMAAACSAESGEGPPELDADGIPRGDSSSTGTDELNGTSPTAAAPDAVAESATCLAQPKCDGAGPALGPARAWNSALTPYVLELGSAYHRGRDMVYATGEPQWIIGKFTYGLIDKEIKGEDVDVFVERGCGGTWEKLGTAQTTSDGEHVAVEGVEDTGGRVYFEIPKAKELGVGRHRVRLVVAGDLTSTDVIVDVVPRGTKVVVTDVDGTLTSSESAEFPALLTGDLPGARPQAAEALSELAKKGYRVVYLTARPEWLTARTHEFLDFYGFPPGIVHTSTTRTGHITTSGARDFKVGELARMKGHGLAIGWAIGNESSDAQAYDAADVQPLDHRVLLGFADPEGGRTITGYVDLLPAVKAAPAVCK